VHVGKKRKYVDISLHVPGDVYVERSGNDAGSKGTILVGKGAGASFDDYSGEINAKASSGTITVGVQEY